MALITYLVCQDCEWFGEPDELVSTADEQDTPPSHCPRCGSVDFEEEQEDDGDEDEDILDDEDEDEDFDEGGES